MRHAGGRGRDPRRVTSPGYPVV